MSADRQRLVEALREADRSGLLGDGEAVGESGEGRAGGEAGEAEAAALRAQVRRRPLSTVSPYLAPFSSIPLPLI